MVRTTTRDDESRAEASVSTPDYRLTGVDLVDVSEGDRIAFTTTTKRSNGVPIRSKKTLTVDDVTVEDVESTEMVEVEPEWLPDDGMFGCDDDVASASVPRDVIETHVEVVAIDDGTRYTLRQTDTGFVNVSSCDQSDFVDQNERGEWNAVARSNVSHGVLKSWSHDEVVTDGGIIVADDDGEIIDDEDDDRVDPDDEGVELITDGGRPPLSSFDHAPTVGPSDVDKCRECGRYAPHAFDHAPECSRFESIDDELSSRTAASNSRMVRPATDGGSVFDGKQQDPERIASEVVAAEVGDRVAIHSGDDDTYIVFEGDVVSTGYKKDKTGPGGTHVVAVRAGDVRVAVHFDRVVGDDWELTEPEPVVFDPQEGRTTTVTRFEGVDG